MPDLKSEALEGDADREGLLRVREAVLVSHVDVGHFYLQVLDHLRRHLLRERIALLLLLAKCCQLEKMLPGQRETTDPTVRFFENKPTNLYLPQPSVLPQCERVLSVWLPTHSSPLFPRCT